MIIQNIKLNFYNSTSVGIVWDVVGLSGDYLFFVERSESPEGPWTSLVPQGLTNTFGFIDQTVNREAFDRHLYYQIRAISKIDGSTVLSDRASINEPLNAYPGKFIARQESLLLRRFTGRKCAIYIRRTFGERCDKCYDSIRGKCIKDSCNECYGTTFKGGYFYPIAMNIQFNPRVKAQDRNALQRTENDQVAAWASNYPILSFDDLIIDLERNNERYLVRTIDPTENHMAIVKQNLGLIKIHLSAPQYMVPQVADIKSIDDVNIYRREFV